MATEVATTDPASTGTVAGCATPPTEASRAELLILSAASESALGEATLQLRDLLSRGDAPRMRDLAYTLRTDSRDLAHRRMLVCSSRGDAINVLANNNPNRLLSGRVEADRRPVVFMLPGVGDQYVGMGHGLYTGWEVFREEVDNCARILEPHIGADIRTVLYPASQSWKNAASTKGVDLKRMLGRCADDAPDPDTVRLNMTVLAQPALFTMEYALARLWISLGIAPDALVGHSMGEYVAACLAGVMSLEDTLRLVAARATLVNALPQAIMLAVMLPEDELLPILPRGLFVSLINGPNHCVIAGPLAEVDAFEQTLSAREVIARRVQNGHAFHTQMLQPILEAFEAEVRKVRLSEPRIPYISNVTGDWVTASEATDPSYWMRHATHTARFSDGLRRMWQLQDPALIECGPGKTLNVLAAQHPDRKGTLRGAIWSMRQRYENEQDEAVLLAAIGKVWLAGGAIGWDQIPGRGKPQLIRLRVGETVATDVVIADSPRNLASVAMESAAVAGATIAGGAQDGGWVADDTPSTERERQLVVVWKAALGTAQIGVNDSFGALGGDSLSSVAALLEMKRLGVPDKIARGLYEGLTIRQMAHLEAAGGAAPQGRNIELSSIDTPIFFRAVAIFVVAASHLGLTTLSGNWTLMVVSGFNFAKFQLRTIEKERSIAPVFRLMLKLAIPCLLLTAFSQVWDHALHGSRFVLGSWFFLDNLMDPRPFKGFESPWFIDLLLQIWLVLAVLLWPRAVRQFAIKKPYLFGLLFLAASWIVSVVVPPLMGDPGRIWRAVPHEYLWLMALGWCAGQSRNDRERLITTAALLALNAINFFFNVGLPLDGRAVAYTVAAVLAIIWLDEIPAQLPRVFVRLLIGAAGASLFIYLTHMSFYHLARMAWKGCPAIVEVAWAMFGGFLVWQVWNQASRVFVQWFRQLGLRGSADLRMSVEDQ